MLKKVFQALLPPEKMIGMFTLQIKCKLGIARIVKKVPAACEQAGFALLHTYIYHDIVKSKGFPIDRQVYIYEICQAKTAAGMLTEFPHFSIFMPCKLAAYENNGETVIATMNMEMALEAVRANPDIYDEAITLFNALKTLMDNISKE